MGSEDAHPCTVTPTYHFDGDHVRHDLPQGGAQQGCRDEEHQQRADGVLHDVGVVEQHRLRHQQSHRLQEDGVFQIAVLEPRQRRDLICDGENNRDRGSRGGGQRYRCPCVSVLPWCTPRHMYVALTLPPCPASALPSAGQNVEKTKDQRRSVERDQAGVRLIVKACMLSRHAPPALAPATLTKAQKRVPQPDVTATAIATPFSSVLPSTQT